MKIKGTAFENEAVKVLNQLIPGNWKRVPTSGALGSILNESALKGDIKGEVQNIPFKFKGECKVGYNNSEGKEVKQFTLKKEWLDKIKQEAGSDFSFPFFISKFENTKLGVKYFIVLDINDFSKLINMISDLQRELDLNYEEKVK